MSGFKKIKYKDSSFEIFPSARVPLVFKKKFEVSLLQDAQNVLMDFEKTVFLIYQCYLAKCRFMGQDATIKEDDILDNVSASDVVKAAFEVIQAFTDDINDLQGVKEKNEQTESEKKIAMEGKPVPKK